jgi:hypothetical protein
MSVAEPAVSRAGPPERDVYTPSRLTLEVRALLEAGFPLLWLEGEIGNFTAAASGHLYFTLKDSRAQVRCVMFRSRASLLRERPRTGDQVLLRARARASSPPAWRNLRKRKKRRAKGRVPVRVPSSLDVSPPFDFLPLRAVVLKNGFLLYRRGLVNKKYSNLKS